MTDILRGRHVRIRGTEYNGQVGEIREVRKDNKFPSKDVYKVAIPGEPKLIQFKGSQVEVLSEVE